MCGIFAYYGHQKKPISLAIEGLKKLEYRGYDSWGIASKKGGKIFIHKEIGKIGEFDAQELERSQELLLNVAENKDAPTMIIGHSRWATHGGVTDSNAHPHFSENKEVVIVHNGIFENYQKIKGDLVSRGYLFRSETDTEVIAHLIDEYMKKGSDLEQATKKAIKKCVGRYAILVICKNENKMIAARRGSPLIIGVGKKENEFFIGSDIPAFLSETNQVMYLDDDQMAVIDENGISFERLETGKKIEKRIVEIQWTEESAEKGDFSHFMIKEITEQKDTLYRTINQDETLIQNIADVINKAYGTYLIGCGTAGKVCMTAEYLFSEIAKKHINATFGSEFPAHKHFLTDRSLLISVSQSGETADSLEAIEVAKEKGAKIISIVNVETSTMARISDIVLPMKVGPEKAVASTKATTAPIALLTLLAYACDSRLNEGKKILAETASQINDMLNPRYEEHILKVARIIKDVESMYIIGRARNYPIALECAIKLQEVSYIHAEGFAGGELKHGPLALITEGTPCITLIANDETKAEIISNATEIKSRGGYIIGVAPENDSIFDFWIKVPDTDITSPIVNLIPIQILAYQLALLRENNPDMPRNLAKSVTVK